MSGIDDCDMIDFQKSFDQGKEKCILVLAFFEQSSMFIISFWSRVRLKTEFTVTSADTNSDWVIGLLSDWITEWLREWVSDLLSE